jgi:hypothetical protein
MIRHHSDNTLICNMPLVQCPHSNLNNHPTGTDHGSGKVGPPAGLRPTTRPFGGDQTETRSDWPRSSHWHLSERIFFNKKFFRPASLAKSPPTDPTRLDWST